MDKVVLSEPQFYPAIYVLVSRLLKGFGDLVYDRLHSLAVTAPNSRAHEQYQHNFIPNEDAEDEETQNIEPMVYGDEEDDDLKEQQTESLPLNFRASHCSTLCHIKCANWFFKISAIRELVPRTLVELALYRSLRFLYPLKMQLVYTKKMISRLRGIANPLISGYVRVFCLEQIFSTLGTHSFYEWMSLDITKEIYLSLLKDVLFVLKAMYDTNFMFVECVFYGQMESVDYLNLLNPTFSMIFQCIAFKLDHAEADDMKSYLEHHIDSELLKLIDLDSFLGIKSDDYSLQLKTLQTPISNVYHQRTQRRKARSTAFDQEQNGNAKFANSSNTLSEMATNFQSTDTAKQ